MDREAFATIGFPDFTSDIFVVFPDYCPATVSDSETVFLCLESSSATPTSRELIASPPTVAAATIAAVHTGSLSLSTDPKRMVVSKVWGVMLTI